MLLFCTTKSSECNTKVNFSVNRLRIDHRINSNRIFHFWNLFIDSSNFFFIDRLTHAELDECYCTVILSNIIIINTMGRQGFPFLVLLAQVFCLFVSCFFFASSSSYMKNIMANGKLIVEELS